MLAPGVSAGGAVPERAAETQPGIWAWDNPRNKFHCIRLHYTADEAKRDPEWRRQTKAGTTERGWQQEYEISFTTGAGQPVFPEFDAGRMVRVLQPLYGSTVCCFYDFGHMCPCVLIAQVDKYGRLRLLAEGILENAPLETLLDARDALIQELFGAAVRSGPIRTFDAGDPSGEKFTDLGSVQQEMLKRGIQLHTTGSWHKGKKEASYKALRSRMMKNVAAGEEGVTPALLIHPRCSILIAALQGGFHLSEKPPYDVVDAHPMKDVCDALRFGNDNLMGVSAPSAFMQRMRQVARADIQY